jgi:hypothetical protein
MNDDIVARLRVHAECPVRWRETDALCQAAADEIERLRAAENFSVPDYDPAIGVVARLRQLGQWRVGGVKSSPIYNNSADRIEELEAALRPFAKWADWHDGAKGTDVERCFSNAEITVGELRAARKALEGGK